MPTKKRSSQHGKANAAAAATAASAGSQMIVFPAPPVQTSMQAVNSAKELPKEWIFGGDFDSIYQMFPNISDDSLMQQATRAHKTNVT